MGFVKTTKKTKSIARVHQSNHHTFQFHQEMWEDGEECTCRFWNWDQGKLEADWEKSRGYKYEEIYIPGGNYCPVCELQPSDGHVHFYEYVRTMLGTQIADSLRSLAHTPYTNTKLEAKIEKKPEDPQNIYRLRVIDKTRKLAVQRVLQGRRRVAVEQTISEMMTILRITKLGKSTVSLSRCEPIKIEKTK